MQKCNTWVGLVVFIVLAAFGCTDSAAALADNLPKLRANVIGWYTRGAASEEVIRRYMRTLREDGSWPDVDYADATRGGWRTYRHVSRTLAMAQAYKQPGHPLAGDAQLRAAIIKALAHWTEKNYVNPNWWYPQIGVPMTVAPILVLMGDEVPSELSDATLQRVLSRSKMGMTGQNKVWLAGIAFLKGLLREDSGLMTQARETIFEELRITTAEGVQPDYSFHQHGPQLQWGNYGASFGGDMIKWAGVFRGTDYALDRQQIAIVGRYLSEGLAWVLWHGRMDISACGRQIFRGCQASKGRGILRQLELMEGVDPGRADVYRAIGAANGPDATNAPTGHKHFWRSDITIHRRPTWYASVKMSSTRVIGAETCNSENMMGLHLGDGVTYFCRTGAEYEDLFPVWDWRRLPGTTCLQNAQSLVPNSKRCRGKSDFVGGVSDGVTAMEYIRGSLHARKAWFFVDDAVVCLGAGIKCDDPEAVLTSVNQCVLSGPVTISTGRRTRELSRGERSAGRLDWVHHDGIGYVFLEPQTATAGAATQSGNWRAIHRRELAATVERDVFNLWIDHGPQPQNARYAYAVLPDVTVEETQSFSDAPRMTVLVQTSSLQAVASADGRKVQAAFFERGRLAWGDDLSIEVDVPCLVMFDRAANAARLHVADPTHRRKALRVRVTGRYTGSAVTYNSRKRESEVTIDLPDAGLAGRTVTVELHR